MHIFYTCTEFDPLLIKTIIIIWTSLIPHSQAPSMRFLRESNPGPPALCWCWRANPYTMEQPNFFFFTNPSPGQSANTESVNIRTDSKTHACWATVGRIKWANGPNWVPLAPSWTCVPENAFCLCHHYYNYFDADVKKSECRHPEMSCAREAASLYVFLLKDLKATGLVCVCRSMKWHWIWSTYNHGR